MSHFKVNLISIMTVTGGIEECKKKWSSVRDQLRRTLQKRKTRSTQPKYKYEDELTFLIPYLGEREGLSNLSKSQDDDYNIHDSQMEFTEETCRPQSVEDEPTTEDIHSTSKDNNIRINNTYSSLVSENRNKLDRFEAIKRKILDPEETPLESPSAQLMAYLLTVKQASRNDPVDAFLGGIAPTLKTLNPLLLNEAKGKIFAIVQEMEMKQLQMNVSSQDRSSKYGSLSFPNSESSSAPHASVSDECKNVNGAVPRRFENL